MQINFSYVLAFLFALVIVVLFLVSLNREADESEYANLAELAKDSKSKNFVNVTAKIKDAMADNQLSKDEYDRIVKIYSKEKLKFEIK